MTYDFYKIDNVIEEGKTWHNFWHIPENATKINDE